MQIIIWSLCSLEPEDWHSSVMETYPDFTFFIRIYHASHLYILHGVFLGAACGHLHSTKTLSAILKLIPVVNYYSIVQSPCNSVSFLYL